MPTESLRVWLSMDLESVATRTRRRGRLLRMPRTQKICLRSNGSLALMALMGSALMALMGASTLILAAFEYISGVGTQLFFVQEATTYNGGCTVCAQQAITGALSTGAVSSTDNVASYLAIADVLILSLMMLKSKVTGKVPGTLGLFFVAYSVAGTAIFPQLSGNVYYDLSQLPFLFFGLWALVSGLKVFGAGGSQGLVPSSMQRS